MRHHIRSEFMQGVAAQPSPKAIRVNLGELLPATDRDDVDRHVRAMEPVTVVNSHIWEAAKARLHPDVFHYAVRLMGLMSESYARDPVVETWFDRNNRKALPHFSLPVGQRISVIRDVIVPCFPKGGYLIHAGLVHPSLV